MPKKGNSTFRISTFIVLIGIILCAVGAFSLGQYVHYKAIAAQADGVVVRVNSEHKRSGRKRGLNVVIKRPVVRFQTTAGTLITATAKVAGSRQNFTLGETLKVEYDPARPEYTLRLATGPAWPDLGLGVLGLGLLASRTVPWLRQRFDGNKRSNAARGYKQARFA